MHLSEKDCYPQRIVRITARFSRHSTHSSTMYCVMRNTGKVIAIIDMPLRQSRCR
jgi:hypothetical protein